MRILLLFLNIIISSKIFTQELLSIPAAKVNVVHTINWQDSRIDVTFFDSVLQSKNLLVLAEGTHADGSSYDAQCMILKGLIDKGQINTIYTESSWINVYEIVSMLKRDGVKSIPETKALMRTVELRYWVDNGFWDYLARKIIDDKVNLFGFDIGGHSSKIIIPMFDEACVIPSVIQYFKLNPKQYDNLKEEYYYYDGWSSQSRYDYEGYSFQKKFIDIVIEHYSKISDSLKVKQWTTILDCFYWMYKRSLVLAGNKYSNVIESELQESEFHKVRDSLMAENFYHTYSKRNDEKAVILVATYHAQRASQAIQGVWECCIYPSVKPMFQILQNKYNLSFFNVGFIAGSGEQGLNYASGKAKKYTKVKPPIKGSLEFTLNKLPYNYCVLNLSDVAEKEFFMNVLYYRYLKADWRKNFDAVFFIKEMKPLIFKNLFN